jgi:hypothetical protein
MTADDLVARADTAMYHSKRQGEGLPVLYEPTLEVVPYDFAAESTRRRVTRRAPRSAPNDDRIKVPVLLGISEVAACLDLTEDHARNMAEHESMFPKPVATLSSAPLWAQDEIVKFQIGSALLLQPETNPG